MSEWISVDEREPEFTGCYLVTGNDIEMEISHFCDEFGWGDSYEITHWMNLPELPESE